MKDFTIALILTLVFLLGCDSRPEVKPVTIQSDKVLADLHQSLRELESDKKMIEDAVKEARDRLGSLSMNPKLYDIAKKDLYAKEHLLILANQEVAHYRLKMNSRSTYFHNNFSQLTPEKLEEEYANHLIDKKSNPVNYPWRIPPSPDEKKTSEKKEENKSKNQGH